MKRHIAWLIACGVLAGCASEPSPIDAPASPTPSQNTTAPTSHGTDAQDSAEAHAAFHFESGTLEIGDFDPYTLGDDIFDPCTEISPEEFAAAGFHNVEPIPEEYAGLARGLNACSFSSNGKVEVELLANNTAPFSFLSKKVEILTSYRSEVLPEIFVYYPRSDMNLDCYAQIDTERGGIVSSAGVIERHSNSPDICAVAVSNLEKLANGFS